MPGGYVQKNETLRDGALRELAEEAGIDGSRLHLEQLGAYADPGRDPRGRVVTVAYLALGPDLPTPVGGTDAARAFWAPAAPEASSAISRASFLPRTPPAALISSTASSADCTTEGATTLLAPERPTGMPILIVSSAKADVASMVVKSMEYSLSFMVVSPC